MLTFINNWPKGGKLSLPFVYSDEVWAGIEHLVASHLIATGNVQHGLDIVRTSSNRYYGRIRNPLTSTNAGIGMYVPYPVMAICRRLQVYVMMR
jgi:Glycosyl-hydrolase family 116, catalytic region